MVTDGSQVVGPTKDNMRTTKTQPLQIFFMNHSFVSVCAQQNINQEGAVT